MKGLKILHFVFTWHRTTTVSFRFQLFSCKPTAEMDRISCFFTQKHSLRDESERGALTGLRGRGRVRLSGCHSSIKPVSHQGWSCLRGCPHRWTVMRSKSGIRRRSRARGHGAAPAPKLTRSSRKRKRTRNTAKPLRITSTTKSLRSSKSLDVQICWALKQLD